MSMSRPWTMLSALVLLAATLYAWAPIGTPAAAPPGVRANPSEVYNPVIAGEPLPDGFRQLLPRDGIRPIYDPAFTEANRIDWSDGTEVIGVAINREAKAYPVSFLNGREMVVDELGGVPILVTW